MATIAPQPKLQFFDANGDPLVGGKLYSYIAGTTTPQATYTDESGSTTNTNPVILDSRGEASVWFGAGTYKLKLTTAADVDVWTVDNIGPAITATDLAAGIQTWLGAPTSANLRAAMVDETGTGALVFANTPVLVLPSVDTIVEATPNVGVTVDGVLLKDSDVSAQDVTGSATVSAPLVNAVGTASASGAVRLFEQTTTGTNYVEIKAPASVSANRVLTLPDSVGSVGQALTTNGSGTLSWVSTGVGAEVFTANGTFTIPANVTRLKITVLGGGGGGGGGGGSGGGAGGGGGGAAIKWLSGVTPGNTLTVTVGAGGAAAAATGAPGSAGGTSSVASGTETITTVSATGGGGGEGNNGAGGAGGIGSNGDMNIRGGAGAFPGTTTGEGGDCIFGGGAVGVVSGAGVAGGAYGGGGSGSESPSLSGAGAAGVVLIEW